MNGILCRLLPLYGELPRCDVTSCEGLCICGVLCMSASPSRLAFWTFQQAACRPCGAGSRCCRLPCLVAGVAQVVCDPLQVVVTFAGRVCVCAGYSSPFDWRPHTCLQGQVVSHMCATVAVTGTHTHFLCIYPVCLHTQCDRPVTLGGRVCVLRCRLCAPSVGLRNLGVKSKMPATLQVSANIKAAARSAQLCAALSSLLLVVLTHRHQAQRCCLRMCIASMALFFL